MKQSTIARRVEWDGRGLHGGVPAHVELIPAPPDSGIVFVRPGEGGRAAVDIPASHRFIHSSSRATTLAVTCGASDGGEPRTSRVSTVEHLLAALYVLEIDNVRVRVDGPELPAMDGSALPIVDQLNDAGRELLSVERVGIRLARPVEIRDRDRWIRAEPADRLRLTYSIDFEHAMIGRQRFETPELDAAYFTREIAGARTFGFVEEVAALRKAGLAQGGSLENTLVLGESGILNEGGLRFHDECVRHKLIDLLGDLALLGRPLHAHVSVEKGGHALHHRLLQAIVAAGE